MKKAVWVLLIGDYFPELMEVTLPSIEAYAKRIGADLKYITERKFPEFPITYEKLQIWELGKEYFWNILIDADTAIRETMPDVTTLFPANTVGFEKEYQASFLFQANKWFVKDERNKGIAGNFVVTSKLTHDLWEPLPMSFEELKTIFGKTRHHIMDEYTISTNLAKYGYKTSGVADESKMLHLSVITETAKDCVKRAKEYLADDLSGQEHPILFREDLPFLFNKLGLTGNGAEIGVQEGTFSKHLLENWQGEKIYLIDSWRHREGYEDIANGDHNIQLNALAKTFMSIYGYQSKATLIRELSLDASKIFNDSFFDWVFLDADHKYESVKEDLETWFPKIKKGGVFCGHDYLDSNKDNNGHTDFGVKKAVDEWAAKKGLRVNTTSKEIFPFWWVQV
jgi:hypothetical protein